MKENSNKAIGVFLTTREVLLVKKLMLANPPISIPGKGGKKPWPEENKFHYNSLDRKMIRNIFFF